MNITILLPFVLSVVFYYMEQIFKPKLNSIENSIDKFNGQIESYKYQKLNELYHGEVVKNLLDIK